jgi:hypothetical protein
MAMPNWRDAPRGLLALHRDGSRRSARLFQDQGWRRLGCAAVERRFWRVDHIKLDRLCDLVAAQLGGEAQGAVDAGRDTSRRHPLRRAG